MIYFRKRMESFYMKRFLFQGDSITDAGRRFDCFYGGESFGYPTFTAGKLGVKYPGQIEFINRGISGNRVVDLYARIKRDFINLKPDIITILIGINDVWHELNDDPNGVSDEKYFKIYSMLIEELKEALPDTTIIILEPFVLKACATQENWDIFRTETVKRAKSAKRVAEKYSLPFIPLMDKFDSLAKTAPAAHWLSDGVHPAPAGHEIIAEAIVAKCEELKLF